MTEKEIEMRNVGGREGADDEFRPQLINLLCISGGWMDARMDDDVTIVDECWQNEGSTMIMKEETGTM